MSHDDKPRLIEHAFPLKQASLTSVHEKNVRHGHISTLHIWPARRPLAACRAALLATLLPDPGTPEERRKLCERIGGTVVKSVERKKMPGGRVVERVKESVEGGVLHWIGTEPKSGGNKKKEEHRRLVAHRESELEWFRQQIREAFGGRAPRVLDPFAGGGAIPLEAMRLGCETTAMDINPVAWFILKCTLEYPQKLAGKTHPLPDFILEDEDFMEKFYEAHPHLVGRTRQTKKQKLAQEQWPSLIAKPDTGRVPRADLAWHVRAWGRWVLNEARKELAQYYPTYADFEPLDLKNPKPYERRPMRLVPLKDDGRPDINALNKEFSKEYLANKGNPRWVAKPTVAYLWARTVQCKNCRATVPLLKTRWLCKKDNKRVLLTLTPRADQSGLDFGVDSDVPVVGGNAAQRREHDKRIGQGTMSKAGAQCPCCSTIMTGEDIKYFGRNDGLDAVCTGVVIEGSNSKEFRLPTEWEISQSNIALSVLRNTFSKVPHGIPNEPTPKGASRKGGGSAFTVHLYGFDNWGKLFSRRQMNTLGTFGFHVRNAITALCNNGYDDTWKEAIGSYLSIGIDRLTDRQSTVCRWDNGRTNLQGTFTRYALPITWDYCEGNPLSETTGSFASGFDWISNYIDHAMLACGDTHAPHVDNSSAINIEKDKFDCIVTDPPYYDAIPYSDLMDFFHIWLRRTQHGYIFNKSKYGGSELSPKWSHETHDGELIDDASRYGGDTAQSRIAYEDGMARAFLSCHNALEPEGRLVVVFAHKHPDAWETLVSAIIRAGFVVDGSWPIQTEMGNRTRGLSSAALASSVWLVCKKRPATARPGWDNAVLESMRRNIREKLCAFWDAGIRGPDFVWAATGPALEAYSKHPIVKKANDPGKTLTVGEFLLHVRRMVVDFVVGQVLSGEQEGPDMDSAERMDGPTAYYLLHRHDFGMDEAPVGACILYATACGVSDSELDTTWDLITHKGGAASSASSPLDEDDDADAVDEDADACHAESESGGKVRLKTWTQRTHRSMGFEAPSGRPIPLIDRVHRLMHLWKGGDVDKVDEYLDDNGLRRQQLFNRLIQSLIELAQPGNGERNILESLSNHIQAKGARQVTSQRTLPYSILE